MTTETITDKYCFFIGGFLSQWYDSDFELDGVIFPTAEHYMMYRKAKLFLDLPIMDRILFTKSPREAKKLGREVRNFNQRKWDRQKLSIVQAGNRAKFEQNHDLRMRLMAIPSHVLIVEASPTDKVWGIGLSTESALIVPQERWPGENLLGVILTNLKNEFLGDAGLNEDIQ